MREEDYRHRVATAEVRIARGDRERTAGADDRARAIASEVERRGRGGARQVAGELGVSDKAVSEAVRRARGLIGRQQSLPGDTLERLLAAELPAVAPLAEAQWQALAWLVRGTVIDPLWIGEPNQLLCFEVEDAELGPEFQPDMIAKVCRSWTRIQALAVIDACQRDALETLPTRGPLSADDPAGPDLTNDDQHLSHPAGKTTQPRGLTPAGTSTEPSSDGDNRQPSPAAPAADGPAARQARLLGDSGDKEHPDSAGLRPRTDEEYSRPLRHHRVAGLGPEWTYAETGSGGVLLWYRKTTRAGGARTAWPKNGWEPMSPQWFKLQGGPQPSRVKALRIAAADFERRRRQATWAGLDVPLPGADGWRLRQTLADRDTRTWQVIGPDDTVAGIVRPSYTGARSWTASHGDPGRAHYYPASVTPAGDDEQDLAAGDGLDWKTRNAAAYAVAHFHDLDGAPSATVAVARAAELRAAGKAT